MQHPPLSVPVELLELPTSSKSSPPSRAKFLSDQAVMAKAAQHQGEFQEKQGDPSWVHKSLLGGNDKVMGWYIGE